MAHGDVKPAQEAEAEVRAEEKQKVPHVQDPVISPKVGQEVKDDDEKNDRDEDGNEDDNNDGEGHKSEGDNGGMNLGYESQWN